MGASFHPSYTVLKGNSGTFRNKGTSLWNFVPNSGFKEILFQYIDRRNALSTSLDKGGRSERDKLDRRRYTKMTIPLSSDARPLQFITGDRHALSTARYSRAGQLATATTCLLSARL